jgi:hypothetical protein
VHLSQIAQQFGIKEIRDVPQSEEQSDAATAGVSKKRQQHGFDRRNTGSRRDHQNVSR